MSKDVLFRKTPFNGYNRDDVTAYIVDQDEKLSELRRALERKNAEFEEFKKQSERLQQEIDNRDGMITVLDDMNKNKRDGEIEALETQIRELNETLAARDLKIESLSDELETLKNESEEILKAAKIKSDYMVKNAEFFAYSTKEKLVSAKKTIDAALSDIDKSISASKEDEGV